MTMKSFSLSEVLAVANRHPFYNPEIQYPLDETALQAVRDWAVKNQTGVDLRSQPLLHKNDIYKTVERLTHDASPENVYRESSYMSITGGGSGGVPMMFAVDVHENRQQRAQMGKLLRICGVIRRKDWVLSVHISGGFYRSLDLTTETMENAGATVLSAGNYMEPEEVVQALAHYHVNVLTGDASQIVQLACYISTLPLERQRQIQINKIIYTSEPLTGAQRAFLHATLGDVKICSVMGSSEAGPWALSNPDLVGEENLNSSSMDFVFDTRDMIIEILSPAGLDDGKPPSDIDPLPLGETGIIVQTSLRRLRNPLVRYITGDLGSLHPLPEMASAVVPESERQYLRVLRMQGRDRRFSFKWYGAYFEFEKMKALLQAEECGILQWQVILDQLESSGLPTLQVRLLRAPSRADVLSEEQLVKRVRTFFLVLPENEDVFSIVFVKNLDGFERSSTAGKVISFVDRLH
ncbi:hypothetical protein BDV35DRAFT_372926 [Aspergillus flavus]|uniref:DNA, SC026 n=6 Tax=Aspergillus subgen. Circumdati TaxID=2720871 RepID=Q2UFS1_ASPOR|nr:unnamed protein product [Aspergillus oryzae RIB40]EIT77054.1 hypothetical protein Ao3042_06892 [Aspergillus oryzae 3.042]KAB8240596.1 hypothetical protein BDV35DRAFT_372926 [Aspergillus flavus]KDE84699.1 hypothetical protein AO1008_11330 [Aspergillus oryzae 100-8]OOO15135.1 hypothetical protein OAory_01037300 [Aspergillus oryzae]BAE59594.1 unnamed protein product [Aspergillus oryzae RIB40]|eukprot:EIT77054.1 hypothetical protein Ao3042_06892 [Aspergillus oryzae 3.042]